MWRKLRLWSNDEQGLLEQIANRASSAGSAGFSARKYDVGAYCNCFVHKY